MKNNNIVLLVAGLLILAGLTKFDFSNIHFGPSRPSSIDVLELTEPSDAVLKKEADDVVTLLKNAPNASKSDFKKLRDLSIDLGRLVELDGEDLVITNTSEIRQANGIAGPMLRLDIKGKYPDLAKEAKEVIIVAIGDDDIVLSPDLRVKAVDGFNALAWAYNEASK